ncbi:MAG TPA: VIT and VWA domain-containing protein [Verrucomicrobiales bacterium]|nr:VIT and VWA domain-containing protein [Verrucomicrobiales bacterium]
MKRLLSSLILAALAAPALAQVTYQLVPTTRYIGRPVPVEISAPVVTAVDAAVEINDQLAVTTLSITVKNNGPRPAEAEMILPVPEGAIFKTFTFDGAAPGATARLLPKDEARRLYDSIVARSKDPAMLEFVGTGALKSSVFPVTAGGTQRVRVTWEQLLKADGNRMDYVLPRTEGLEYNVPWTLDARIKASGPVGAIYSPSHDIAIEQNAAGGFSKITLRPGAERQPGSVRLSILRQEAGMSASITACPDEKGGGGYFLMLIAPPAKRPDVQPMKRELTLVLDKSGSMAGGKLDQVKTAALQAIEGLADGEAFNLIVYYEAVESFASSPVIKSPETTAKVRDYIKALRPSGGTNIHDALLQALRQPATPNMLPVVVFLTDGLPTVGVTAEKAIREAVARENPHQRRIFTFGVGVDVNTPLLTALARGARGTTAFVLPGEDVEMKMGSVSRRLSGPLLADVTLTCQDTGRIQDLLPAKMPDVFENDQIVLLGRYAGAAPLKFELAGRDGAGERKFQFEFQLDKASVTNTHVPRLWAARRIATLTEAVRDLGQDSSVTANDLRVKELTNEIVRLSREFGVLSEYTAFFADDGTPLASATAPILRRMVLEEVDKKALQTRAGQASVNQDLNLETAKAATCLNARNGYWNAGLTKSETANVQQISDRAYYKKGERWIDSKATAETAAMPPDRVIEIGTPEFASLVDDLAASGRLASLSLRGEILMELNGKRVLVR